MKALALIVMALNAFMGVSNVLNFMVLQDPLYLLIAAVNFIVAFNIKRGLERDL